MLFLLPVLLVDMGSLSVPSFASVVVSVVVVVVPCLL